ncbi:unnamed protein product [Cladocopium goreaui]|uniref:Uncharacterized protein n=1 Tax=Cladocopium goreaui TaxID=2562237 RepID=A0A9P1FRQ1_9DINO|nr:unnamed protein product [Cladocopium goreaui]
MASQLRRKPNAFNLLHQMNLLRKFNSLKDGEEVWAKACEISEAYVVGKAESQAALHLYNDVSPRIALQHSMAKFLTHESIAAGAWNQNYCSATDTMQAWQETLTNTEQILDMTVDRMSRDWLSLAPKMRKAFTLKDVEYYQRSSAIFLACMSRFESEFPIDFVEKERPRIKRFDLKHGDAELVGMLEGAPPVDLERCGIFRTAIAKFQRQAEDEKVKASEEQLGWPASTKGCQAYQMHMQTCCNFNLTVVERQARFAAVSSLHKTFGFSKSHVFLGVLGPITRARVTELISDVQQRGVIGTKEILLKLIDGLDIPPDSRVFVTDLTPNKFNEWGRAVWELQKACKESGRGHDWRYTCYYDEEWWDKSAEAGPQSRPGEQFQEVKPQLEVLAVDSEKNILLPDSILASLGHCSAKFTKALQVWNEDHSLTMRGNCSESQPPTPTPSRGERSTPRRTRCSPAFTAADQPKNLQKVIEPATVLSEVGIVATDTYELWLLNDTDELIELDACELFGFGMGAYVAKAAGTARSEGDKYIPWILNKDTDVVIQVAESGKSPTCISEMACQAAQRQGLTEMTLVDHSLTQRVQENEPLPFRYDVQVNGRTNVYEHKPLADSVDRLAVRPTLFGLIFAGNFGKLPTTQAQLAWEVLWTQQV